MTEKALSPREEQIVALATLGLTNEGIGQKLGISASTVSTYWLRIRTKVSAESRTEIVAKVIQKHAEEALREANSQKMGLTDQIAQNEVKLLDLRAAISLLQLAMDQLRSAVWATGSDLRVTMLANGEIPHFHDKLNWQVGNTIYEVFNESDKAHPAMWRQKCCSAYNRRLLFTRARRRARQNQNSIKCI